jgi:hypothetical protein
LGTGIRDWVISGWQKPGKIEGLRVWHAINMLSSSLMPPIAWLAACHADYMDDVQLEWVRTAEAETERLLNGYIGFIRKQQQGGAEFGRTVIRDQEAEYNIALSPGLPQEAVVFTDP